MNLQKMPAEIKIPLYVREILDRFYHAGKEAYAVGGCIRDSLLNREPDDWDITTQVPPQEVQKLFDSFKIIPTGIKHGTVTILSHGYPVEVTTYRIDGSYSDARHPDRVRFSLSLYEDLARRDFTINALACCRDGSEVIDCFGGLQDLKSKIIRCVGSPGIRFEEDALRILRALRFSSTLNFKIESETAQKIREKKALLLKIAPERLNVEFSKLLCGQNVQGVLSHYRDVIGVFLPELLPIFSFPQAHPFHSDDVGTHTLKSVSAVPPELSLRLTMLLHDSAKPDTASVDEKGVSHFYGHAEQGAQKAADVLKRLRYDNATIDEVTTLIRYHDLELPLSCRQWKRLLNRLGVSLCKKLLAVRRADILAQNPAFLNRIPDLEKSAQILQEVVETEACFSLRDLAVNGKDLIDLGMSPGKNMGILLKELLQDVIEDRCPNQKEPLLALAQKKREALLWNKP